MNRDIVVIGGSAGSWDALRTILTSLPHELPASVFVVVHLSPRAPSHLREVLSKQTSLHVNTTRDGETIESGQVYVAPPDRHMVISGNHIHLTRSPKEGLHRPSINLTFRSAAQCCGDRVVGVLLSGMLDDGAAGLWDVARHGGVSIVQDPQEAPFPSMPATALEDAPINFKLRASEIGPMVVKLVSGAKVSAMESQRYLNKTLPERFVFTCPECRGPMYQPKDREGPIEFRCRVGHVFTLEAMLDEAVSVQERKLYEAIVALEEGADLAEYAASKVRTGNGNLLKEAEQLREHAAAIRKLVEERATPPVEE